jgi:hypothetical protein
MRGLAGVVDWKLCGEISSLLRLGGLSGKLGTCTYIPVQWNDRVLHLFFAGAGFLKDSLGPRPELQSEAWNAVKKNLLNLKVGTLALSGSDLGGINEVQIKKHLSGISVRWCP